MASPDYSKYTLDELYDVLENIDKKRWPDRVSAVEEILNNPDKVKSLEILATEEQEKSAAENEKTGKYLFGGLFAFMGLLALVTGTLYYKGGSIELDSWPERILIALSFLAIGASVIRSSKTCKN